MPEIVTKNPEMVLTILKDAGIKCGTGEKQRILTNCPKENFCLLPTGELCIYGVQNLQAMTQMTPAEAQHALNNINSTPAIVTWMDIFLWMLIFLVGFFVAKVLLKKGRGSEKKKMY